MISVAELDKIARARLEDAQVLLDAGRFDGAAYLCGYAVEIALKARICRTLNWADFPSTGGEFQAYRSFQTHDLRVLLRLSGQEERIKNDEHHSLALELGSFLESGVALQCDWYGAPKRYRVDGLGGRTVVGGPMTTLDIPKKFIQFESEIAQEKGPFTFFALFKLEDFPDRWDLLVAAPWMGRGKEKWEAVRYLLGEIKARLGSEALISVSRIVPVDQDHADLQDFNRAIGRDVEHEDFEIRDRDIFGQTVREAHIITSKRPPAPVQVG